MLVCYCLLFVFGRFVLPEGPCQVPDCLVGAQLVRKLRGLRAAPHATGGVPTSAKSAKASAFQFCKVVLFS